MELENKNILVVEDEADIAEILSYQITQMNCMPDWAGTGEEALAKLNRKTYDLIVLDWMLPGLSGVEIAQLVRKIDTMKNIGILMLTAKADGDSIVAGLDAGADDYMTKPFEIEIFQARVKSLLRRTFRDKNHPMTSSSEESTANSQVDEIKIGPLQVSLKSYRAYLDGQEISLTPSEFKLLTTMVKDRGRVLTRAHLIEEVQGEGISVIGRTIDTHVFGLRRKLGKCAHLIETIRGVGYRVRDDLV